MIASITTKAVLGRLAAAALLSAVAAGPALAQKTGDDTILRAVTRGTAALARGDTALASRDFDVAITNIGAIWGNTPEAQQARSLWYEESVKPFKGDPYERMMAYYYRGLLFLQRGDYGNAQAAFRQSVQQDGFAEEEQHNHDVALPLFLQGWALQAQGSKGPARDAYEMVAKLRPDFTPPDATGPQPRVLVVVETGYSPRKVPDGVGAYKIKYFRGKKFTETRALVGVNGAAAVPAYPLEDVYWQAASRGGRKVDAIFEGKASFAQTNENVGSALSSVATEMSFQRYNYSGSTARDMGKVGDALGVVGIAALALSAKAKPAADARYWDNLPDAVHVLPLDLAPGEHRLAFSFAGADGAPVAGLEKEITVTVPADGSRPQVVWVSSRDRGSRFLTQAGVE